MRPVASQPAQLLCGSSSPLKPPSIWKPDVATPTKNPSPSRLVLVAPAMYPACQLGAGVLLGE